MNTSRSKLRIAIGGIRHETNTFWQRLTEYQDFGFRRGQEVVGQGLRLLGQKEDVQLLPAFVASAMPSGTVRKTAYLRLKEELLCELQATLPVDGIYLDLHGAMEVEEIGDGESDLILAVRDMVGPDILISVSLDLHGNISPILAEHANILTAFRTAPHRDYEETRQRALALLMRALKGDMQPVSMLIKPPILLAGESAVTDVEPARSLYARLPQIGQMPGLMDASILIGCAWTDSPYTRTSVIVVAERDRAPAQQQATQLAGEIWARRSDFCFGVEAAPVDEAIRRAMNAAERPVYLSDSGDNVTAGGAGDIPFFVERLTALHAQDALVAGLADAQAVQRCIAAGTGQQVTLEIGGKLDPVNGSPLAVTGYVEHIAILPPSSTGGATAAVLRVGSVRILLVTDRRAFVDRTSIAATGVDPNGQKIVVVKQGYLFPDLADHAPRAILALSPGATDLRLEELPYQRVLRPIFPLDRNLSWEP